METATTRKREAPPASGTDGGAMDGRQLEFTVYLIHSLGDAWGKPYSWVYRTLDDTGILDGYIIPCYDVLHTQGERYLVDDVTGFVREKGIVV